MSNESSRQKEILGHVDRYYSARIQEHGATPRGVDWNGEESQFIRFAQLSKVFEGEEDFSVNDLGCGYGAYLEFLQSRGLAPRYTGYDISEDMVEAARARWNKEGDGPEPEFLHDSTMRQADYTVASGIFNVKQDVPESEWLGYVLDTLGQMDKASRKGFSFNMLTAYSDPPFMRGHLWYPAPGFIFDYCMQRFSRKVALSHDYQLYEFTILVRKNPRT